MWREVSDSGWRGHEGGSLERENGCGGEQRGGYKEGR